VTQRTTDKERLDTIISQGRIVLRRMYGVGVLTNCLMRRAETLGESGVDAEWLNPALEVLEKVTSETMEWWDARLDVAGGRS